MVAVGMRIPPAWLVSLVACIALLLLLAADGDGAALHTEEGQTHTNTRGSRGQRNPGWEGW